MVATKSGDPFNLNSFPHMDVVNLFIFNWYHKTEDIVKHHNHDPTLKHQQTWSIVPSNQICALFVLFFCSFPHPAYLSNFHRTQIYYYLKSVHSIISRFCQIEGALNFFFIFPSHWFFPLSGFSVDIMECFIHLCSIKVLFCGHQNYLLE